MPSAREWIALGWMAGALVFLLWVGGRAVRYTAWLRARREPLPPGLRESVQDLSLGFQVPEVAERSGCWTRSVSRSCGACCGEASTCRRTSASLGGSDQQRSVLAHELSHIARFDAGVNLLQVLAQAVYWFHPFVWWANRKIRQEREKCCDEMAVAHLHTPPEHYTGAIVDALAAERRSAHPIPSLAIVGSVRDIEERIKTMLRPGKTFRRRPSLVAATIALLIALVTIPTALVLTARGPTQATAQSIARAGAIRAGIEEPGPPRYAARTFNCKAALDVRVSDKSNSQPRSVGRTPSPTPVEIPACWLWLVKPVAPIEDWDVGHQRDKPKPRSRFVAEPGHRRRPEALGGFGRAGVSGSDRCPDHR